MLHCLLCKLGIHLVLEGEERDTAIIQNVIYRQLTHLNKLTSLNLAPFAEMPQQRLLCLILIRALVDLGNVQRPVRTVERTHSTHVIAVLCVLFSSEAVARVVDQLVRQW